MKHAGIFVMVAVSISYIAAIGFLRGNDAWELLRTGNLNELGDFLAGVFTPLAFGWLVYGYLLQSKELRLQREELALTRNQLGKQTELLQEQVTADHQDSIPHLTLRIASPGNDWDWIVENKGGHAKSIELIELLNRKEKRRIAEKNSLARGESFRFTVSTIAALLSPMRRATARTVQKGSVNAGRSRTASVRKSREGRSGLMKVERVRK